MSALGRKRTLRASEFARCRRKRRQSELQSLDFSEARCCPPRASFAHLQLNVRTRKNVAVSLAKVFKRGTFVPRAHRDRRRGRRNEIDQQQRDCAYCKHGRSRCFEDLPATESQHSHFPEPQSAVMKANSLCHRGVRATNGHLIRPPRSGNELAPVQSIELHLLTLAR
jgi:hypothetical protein